MSRSCDKLYHIRMCGSVDPRHVQIRSDATEMGRMRYVRLPPDGDRRGGDIAECPKRAKKQNSRIHSITSSARSKKDSESRSPSALAVFRLITNSNRSGCCTGKSSGFTPCRIFCAYEAPCRNSSE